MHKCCYVYNVFIKGNTCDKGSVKSCNITTIGGFSCAENYNQPGIKALRIFLRSCQSGTNVVNRA